MERKPEFWNRHSPILFPNVGKTHGNTVLIKGTQYPTSQHGFARDSQFRCVKSAAEEAQFLFCSNEETREVYPYDFELYITYRLDGKNIFVDWKVKNPSEETIYFTIGAHPAFMFEGSKGDERRLSSVVFEDGNAGMLRAESGMRNRPAGRKLFSGTGGRISAAFRKIVWGGYTDL